MATVTDAAPRADEVDAAVAALPHVREYLLAHPDAGLIKLHVDDEAGNEPLVLPRAALELLARILGHMAIGQGVSIVPAHAELTTQQAADLLNVSRPFLIGLLEANEIDYRRVGKHRRVLASSLLAYKRTDDARRRQDADALSADAYELGFTSGSRRASK